MLQYNTVSCRPERRHISFPRIVGSSMSSTQGSHLLPTYARVDLAFERGEGAWLVATNGDRYLDFTSGVAVNALGHAHPHLVEAIGEQAKTLWHVSNLYRIPEAERLATLAAGGQKKYLDGFGPVVEGFDQMPFADLAAVRRAVAPETAAILIEPIMGEGGVRVVAPEFLRALRQICDENGLLLMFDEVQTGMGRTG